MREGARPGLGRRPLPADARETDREQGRTLYAPEDQPSSPVFGQMTNTTGASTGSCEEAEDHRADGVERWWQQPTTSSSSTATRSPTPPERRRTATHTAVRGTVSRHPDPTLSAFSDGLATERSPRWDLYESAAARRRSERSRPCVGIQPILHAVSRASLFDELQVPRSLAPGLIRLVWPALRAGADARR